MMLFVLVLLALHLLFGVACWLLALLSGWAWPRARASRAQWVWIWTLALVFALLLHNAAEFPGSSLGQPYAPIAGGRWRGLSLDDLVCGAVALAAMVTLATAAWRTRAAPPRRWLLGASAACVAIAVLVVACGTRSRGTAGIDVAHARPNVILIGIDSLRNDLLPAAGLSALAPNIGRYLQHSTRFTNATTPLARTFPSWVSILTGEHPRTTGGALNLLPRDLVHTGDALGFILRQAGYRTAYGIDEARFSNIDSSYGFDQTITPPIGASEFMIGWFGDTPLSNAIVNTRAGQWLLPHLHANRGAATTFDPDVYVQRVARELQVDERPLFLALHLTLAHWPYTWKDSTDLERDDDPSSYAQYRRAVRRVDAQFATLMAALQQRNLLANAIVIVLSDHGESFKPGSDSVGPEDSSALQMLDAVPGWARHPVLAPDQFRVVLHATARDGSHGPAAHHRCAGVLEDINPTVLDLLGIGRNPRADGQSLASLLRGDDAGAATLADRIRFTESEFTPKGIVDATQGLSASVAALASRYYIVDPVTDRLQVRREHVSVLLEERQLAAMTDHELLAAIPDPVQGGFRYILVREPFRQGATVEPLDGPPDAAHGAAATRLWQALQERFARSLGARPLAATPATPATPSQS
jgi:arylsulfatase A-like enzyme